jgi:suppressor of ftsI
LPTTNATEPGQKLWALTYNGVYMPPTLRFRPGDTVKLTLVNRLDAPMDMITNLHTHGLHVSPSGNSDNVFLHIHPGTTFDYVYHFPLDEPTGTYWYHPHYHGLTAPQTAGGMSGIIIVDGLQQYLPRNLRHITEHVIGLKDFQIDGDAIKTLGVTIGAATNRSVNGQLNPTIRIRPGETQLWRLANISANIYYNVRLRGQRFYVIATDGIPVRQVYATDTLVMAAANRFDVLVQGGPPGSTILETLPYSTGPAGNQFPQANLATVVSAGKPQRPAQLPTTFAPTKDLSNAPIAARRTIVFSENAAGTEFFINGKQFDPNRVDVRVKVNTVEEWVIRNISAEQHTYHVHVNDFQVMSINGVPQPFRGLVDTVTLPANGEVVIRNDFSQFIGKTVFHCHILNHEDAGMMAVLEIVR